MEQEKEYQNLFLKTNHKLSNARRKYKKTNHRALNNSDYLELDLEKFINDKKM